MAINKVEYGGNTLIDLTSDSVTPENLLSGVTAHDASGKKINGTFDPDKYLEKTGDASDTTVTFVQATNRANISSKEKFSVIMGKIAKFFADLKTVAFTGKYSDLSGTPGVVSKTANGLCPKNGGTTTKFLRDDGTYAEPTASVSGLSTLEQVTAAATAGNVTDPVGAGAVNELNSSLGGMKFGKDGDGNCGYYGADGSLIPFKSGTEVAIFMGVKNMVAYNILILSDGTCKNAESTPLIGNKMKVNGSTYTALKSGKFKIVIPRVSTDSTVFTAVEKYVNAGNTIFQGADLGYGILGSCVYAID